MSEAGMRPSGLKPPSKIAKPTGRVTNGALPKTNGVASGDPVTAAVDKLTRELARRRLSEADTSDMSSSGYVGRRMSEMPRKTTSEFGDIKPDRRFSEDLYKKKYCAEHLSPVDLLYEQQRRLSEAGIRRGSDASVVLTEDTESFIIGDRVWVGGTKPGHIQYIGETQFAPGEWAGVVLDEPTGKNDGSVGGVRYFMCEAKKGVFSRLTKLTREPLIPLGEDLPGSNASSRAGSRKTTPVARDVKSPSPPISGGGDVKLGERVLVASSSGTKSGLLRYLGTTEFAPGEWAGVELDQPNGKNDGSVAGKRYFECRPKFGLFAPVQKVSKAPPGSRRMSSSAGLRRGGSRESLSSVTSSTSTSRAGARVRLGASSLSPKKPSTTRPSTTVGAVNNALQIPVGLLEAIDSTRVMNFESENYLGFQDDWLPYGFVCNRSSGHTRKPRKETLKEKEQHIEQLLKERDLERSEVARSVSHADEMEQTLNRLQQEHGRLQKEIVTKEGNNKLLSRQLEEERRKNEEMEFRLEEGSINMTDMQNKASSDVEKIESLERLLKIEKERVEQLEKSTEDEFQTAEELSTLREQVETLQKKLDDESNQENLREAMEAAQDKAKELESLYTQENEKNLSREKEIEVMKKRLEEAAETEERLIDLRKTVGALEEERIRSRGTEEALQQETQGLRKRLSNQETATEQLQTETQAQQMQMNQMKHQLKEAEERYQQLSDVRQRLENELTQKIASNEDTSSEVGRMRETIRNLEQQLEEAKSELSSAKTEINIAKEEASQWKNLLEESKDKIQTEMKQQDEQYSQQLGDLNERIQKSEHELLQSKRAMEELAQKKDIEVYELQEANLLKDSEISDMQDKLKQLKENLSSVRSSTKDTANVLELRTQEFQAEVAKHKKMKEEAEKNLREATQSKAKLETENLQLRRDMEEFKLRVSDRDLTVMNLTAEVERLRQTFSAHKEQLEEELQANKQEAEASEKMREQVLEARSRADEYQAELQESRAKVEELTEQMNLTVTTAHQQQEQQDAKLKMQEIDKQKMAEELKHLTEEADIVKESNTELSKMLSNSEREKAALMTQLSNVQSKEQREVDGLRAELEAVEREKTQLENKVVDLQVAVAASQRSNVNHHEPKVQELMEEKDTQIEFLNSVIVDMQRKNDELKTRIDILQEDFVKPGGVNNNRNGVRGRSVAPRLYCDICEQFDIHDTEDCPRQAGSPSPPPTRSRGSRSEERPYCEICEIFGHWTNECDDTETF